MNRRLLTHIRTALDEVPVVALLGPRQAGKTTLALEVGKTRAAIYLDLESAIDRTKLTEPEAYLTEHENELVILDEIQRTPQMLAHQQGDLLNAAALARALAVDGKTVASYVDLLVDLLLVRRLLPWHGNARKRLVKSPKVYVRDCGLVHALLGITDREALLAHPVAGGSWEGLAIESLIAAAPDGTEVHFFRTSAGAEIDLLLTLPGRRHPWAIEIKRAQAPKLERGFRFACDTVHPERRLVVYGGAERFPIGEGVEAISLIGLCDDLSAM